MDGNTYPNYPLAPDFQGCGYSDPDHSWEGLLVEHKSAAWTVFCSDPHPPVDIPGVKLAAANTFPIGYYSNLIADRTAKTLPDLPSSARWPRNTSPWTAISAPSPVRPIPNRFYQHAGTDRPGPQLRDALYPPTIWDQLSPD